MGGSELERAGRHQRRLRVINSSTGLVCKMHTGVLCM